MARFHPKKYVKPTRHLTDKKLLKPSHNSKNPSSSTFPYWKTKPFVSKLQPILPNWWSQLNQLPLPQPHLPPASPNLPTSALGWPGLPGLTMALPGSRLQLRAEDAGVLRPCGERGTHRGGDCTTPVSRVPCGRTGRGLIERSWKDVPKKSWSF